MQNTWRRTRAASTLVVVALAMALGLAGRSVEPAEAATVQTLWGSSAPPAGTADDSSSVELGTAFTATADGVVSGIRYWRTSGQTGSRTVTLWSSDGDRLATATSPASDGTGWQTAVLATPVKVAGGDSFVVSYHAPDGHYAFTADYHGSALASGLTIPGSSAGRYAYASTTRFPTSSYRSTNYWVTPEFTLAAEGGVAPPTTPAPASSGKPGPSNTGVPAGTTLTRYTGPHTITTAGTVIDSKDVTGGLVVRAKDVVIRNSKVHDDFAAVAGIYVEGSGSATITDTEIYDVEVGITYSNWTAIRVDIHDTISDGLKISSNVRLQDSWVHDARPSPGAHWDGGQVQNGVVNTVLDGNVIDATGADTNTALFLTPDLGPSTNGPLTVTDNWLDGGNFTLSILDGDNGRYYIDNISVKNNRFGHGGFYGPAHVDVPVSWSGNIYDDSGKTVSY